MCAHVDDDEDDDGGGDGDDGGQWKLATVIYGPFAGAFGKHPPRGQQQVPDPVEVPAATEIKVLAWRFPGGC